MSKRIRWKCDVHKARLVCVSSLSLAFGALTWSATAAAETAVSVALSVNRPSDEADPAIGVGGVDASVGPRLNLAILDLTTEVTAGAHAFGGSQDANVYRAMAGGRLGIGAIIRPSIFSHIGVGHLRYDALGTRQGRTQLAGDVGVALEFTALPVIDFGVFGSYNGIAATSENEPFRWLQTGLLVTLFH